MAHVILPNTIGGREWSKAGGPVKTARRVIASGSALSHYARAMSEGISVQRLISRPLLGVAMAVLLPLQSAVAEEISKARQPLDPESRFGAYVLKGEGNFGLRLGAAAMDKKMGMVCDYKADAPNLKIAIKKFHIERDVAFPESARHPVRGSWSIRYAYTRCGEKVIYNTIFAAREKSSPKMLNLYPGYSDLNPVLMGRVGRKLLAKVREDNLRTECNDIRIVDTSQGKLKKGSETIHEIWSVMACSQPINYEIAVTKLPEDITRGDIVISKLGEQPAKPVTAP
ncbi:MAG TPA: hypothetical protein DCS82_11420 [Rhodospirillaceae bacterium]|nr:hypothetical protein [Rhodospirillaceae bacterium]HAT36319.1 hypothetical protein [Rhodospirillaceae bacterium]